MQLLYGNDGNNYRTLARTADMNDIIEKELKEAYLNYRFVEHSDLYTSVENQPVSITYVTTNLGNIFRHEQIMICKNARMSCFSTPSSYAHFIINSDDGITYGRKFYDLLRYSFIGDVEAGQYTDAMLEQFVPALGEVPEESGLPEDILKVLVGVILVKDKSTSQVRIILDQDGDRYNQRSLEVIQAIYRYLPWDLKKRSGFCTYAAIDQNVAGRVKIILMPASASIQTSADIINLNNPNVSAIYRSLNNETKEYVEYLFAMTDEEREDYFESIAQMMNGKSLYLEDYINLYKTTDRWDKEPLESIFQEWLVFALKNVNSKSPVMEIFKRIVTRRLSQEVWNYYIKTALEQQDGHVSDWSQSLKQMILFADMFESLALPKEEFTGWLEERIMKPLHESYEEYEYITKAEEEKQFIITCDLKSQKFSEIRIGMLDVIDRDVREEHARIEQQISMEKHKIAQVIWEQEFIYPEELNHAVKSMSQQLKYPEHTTTELEMAWEDGIQRLLSKIQYFYSEEEMGLYEAAIKEGLDMLRGKDSGVLKSLLKKKGQWLKELEKNRNFILNEEEDVEDANIQLKSLKRQLQSTEKSQSYEAKISIGRENGIYTMRLLEVGYLLEFLRKPAQINFVKVKFTMANGMVESLLSSNCLKRNHLYFLLEAAPELIVPILNKYYKSERLRPYDSLEVCKYLKEHLSREEMRILGVQLKKAERAEELKHLADLLVGKNETGANYLLAVMVGGISMVLCGCLAALNFFVLSNMMNPLFVILFYVINILVLIVLLVGTVCYAFDY